MLFVVDVICKGLEGGVIRSQKFSLEDTFDDDDGLIKFIKAENALPVGEDGGDVEGRFGDNLSKELKYNKVKLKFFSSQIYSK